MRKRVKKKTLHRDKAHRKSLLKNLSTQLIIHEQITTTQAKAKFLRPHVEKLITKAKRGNDFNNIKYMKKMLSTADAIEKMLADVGPRNKKRPGGYTRIIKVGNRQGDNAPMAKIELVEKPAKKVNKKPAKSSKKKEVKPKEKPEVKPEKEKVEMRTPKKSSKVRRVLEKTRGRPKKTTGKGK